MADAVMDFQIDNPGPSGGYTTTGLNSGGPTTGGPIYQPGQLTTTLLNVGGAYNNYVATLSNPNVSNETKQALQDAYNYIAAHANDRSGDYNAFRAQLAFYQNTAANPPLSTVAPPPVNTPPPVAPIETPASPAPVDSVAPVVPVSDQGFPKITPPETMGSDWKGNYSGLGGLVGGLLSSLFIKDIPGVPTYKPVTAPTFPKLATKQNEQGLLGSESQSLFPWQSIRLPGDSVSNTDYLNDYRKDSFNTPETMGLLAQPKQSGNALRDLQNIGSKQVLPQTPEPKKEEPKYLEEFNNNYLDDWKKSNKDNLTKGIWQAYA